MAARLGQRRRRPKPFVEEMPAALLALAGQVNAELAISAVVAISQTIYYRARWRVQVRALEGVLGVGEVRTLLEAGQAALGNWLPPARQDKPA